MSAILEYRLPIAGDPLWAVQNLARAAAFEYCLSMSGFARANAGSQAAPCSARTGPGSGPLVSVVMAVYNGRDFLGPALDSLLAQTFSDFELIAVDDGSTDGSSAMLDDYARRDGRVRVIHQAGAGVARARNVGLAHSRGSYIAVADADDVYLPERLAVEVDYLEHHPAVAAVGSSVLVIDEGGRLTGQRHDYPTDSLKIRRRMRRHSCIAHSTAMVRADAMRAIGGYRPVFRLATDYDFWLRLLDHHDCVNLPQPLVYYRYRSASISMVALGLDRLAPIAAAYDARYRRRHGVSPLDCQAELTPQLLARIGISQAIIDLNLAAACLSKARRVAKYQAPQDAQVLLERYAQMASVRWIRLWLAPWEWSTVARIRRRQGRLGRALAAEVVRIALTPMAWAVQLLGRGRGVLCW